MRKKQAAARAGELAQVKPVRVQQEEAVTRHQESVERDCRPLDLKSNGKFGVKVVEEMKTPAKVKSAGGGSRVRRYAARPNPVSVGAPAAIRIRLSGRLSCYLSWKSAV